MQRLVNKIGLWLTLTVAFACGGRAPHTASNASTTASGGANAPTLAGASAGSGGGGGSKDLGGAGRQSSAGTPAPAGGSGASAGSSGAHGQAGMAGVSAAAGASGASGSPLGGQAGGGAAPALPKDAVYVPHASWTCGMPQGIPPATGELVFEADLQLGAVHDLGDTQYGHRRQLDVKSGSLKGPKIEATVLAGGLDYELTLANGALEIEQINMLRTSDSGLIFFRSCGTAPSSGAPVRMVPDLEAPTSGAYAFLNSGRFVGTRELDAQGTSLKLAVYAVAEPAASAPKIAIENPSGVPDQTWDCKKASGQKGAEVYKESVGISGSLMVGASKHGTRNVIPITGGTTTGRVAGTVLSGGGDYQILGSSFVIDARYTLMTSDGELIIVRNCGPGGALVPVFEAKQTGNYGWLNANHWLSSDPGVATGAVNLTIYEQQ